MVQPRDLPACVTCSTFLFIVIVAFRNKFQGYSCCCCVRRAHSCSFCSVLSVHSLPARPRWNQKNMHKWYAHNRNYKSINIFEHKQSSVHICNAHSAACDPPRRTNIAPTDDSRNTLLFYFFFRSIRSRFPLDANENTICGRKCSCGCLNDLFRYLLMSILILLRLAFDVITRKSNRIQQFAQLVCS